MARIIDAETVIYRLQEAGATLLSLPFTGGHKPIRSNMPECVREQIEAYGWTGVQNRPAVPTAATITRMDEAFGWIELIPPTAGNRYTADLYSPHGGVMLRRIVGARALVSPITERHLYSWRRLADRMGASHMAAKAWHAQGIDVIVKKLCAAKLPELV